MLKKGIIVLLFAILKTGFSFSQIIIKNFTAQSYAQSQVVVNWVVGAGSNACFGLELHHSTDSFKTTSTKIYDLPTVCGASGSDETYTYTHTQPDVHGKNYYRIYTPLNGYSTIIMLDFGAENGSYVLFPDPINDNSLLQFKNPNNEQYILEIYNATTTKKYILPYNYTNQILISKSWFDTGIFYFRLYSLNGDLIKGKFIVIQ